MKFLALAWHHRVDHNVVAISDGEPEQAPALEQAPVMNGLGKLHVAGADGRKESTFGRNPGGLTHGREGSTADTGTGRTDTEL